MTDRTSKAPLRKIFRGFLCCLSPVWSGTLHRMGSCGLRSVHVASFLPTGGAVQIARPRTLHSLTCGPGLCESGPPGATPRPSSPVGRWEGCCRGCRRPPYPEALPLHRQGLCSAPVPVECGPTKEVGPGEPHRRNVNAQPCKPQARSREPC